MSREAMLVTEEPLALGLKAGVGNVIDSSAHVPGSAFRGALAARWIAQHGLPNRVAAPLRQEFLKLFEGAIRYGPLYADGSMLEPLTVRRCKYEPEAGSHTTVDDAHSEQAARCRVCGSPLERGKGRVVGLTLGELTSVELTVRETAASGKLFSRRHISPGTVLRGFIDGDHPWLQAVPEVLWIGGRRSVGGRARLTCRAASPPRPEPRPDGQVLVRLEAPGIFVDDAGRPSLDFPVQEIGAALGVPVERAQSWTRPVTVSGWHAASNLPKPTDVALAAGSAVLLQPRKAVSVEALQRLSRTGLGLRRAEGFGWLAVNPPPWQPPPSTSVPREESAAVPLAAAVPDDLRNWLAPRLKEFAVQLEHAGCGRGEDITDRPRYRKAPQAAKDAVDQLLDLGVSALNDAIVLLEERP
ncbi:MAG: type III-B CRISPR module-associated Cmr3 family protein [Egibacteraceae bacterium]